MIPSDQDFVIDIGRADKGRTFVRVRHVETGKERIQVGLDGSTTAEVSEKLALELIAEVKILQHRLPQN